jgi:hypothetical protein
LSFLVLIHGVLRKYKDTQLFISTHSPLRSQISALEEKKHRIELTINAVRAAEATLQSGGNPRLKQIIEVFETHNDHDWSMSAVLPTAYEAYLQGMFFRHKWTEASLFKSIELFTEANRLDSEFALGYAGLSRS